ncbi:MAG: gliding motility-associated C-terminal domain-containing protein [Bacteroidales bacterium]|nr:gliding motility-associated C-terminal domain-containing protein [Bacteroidales bacterium]
MNPCRAAIATGSRILTTTDIQAAGPAPRHTIPPHPPTIDFELTIYSRSGLLIFKTKDPLASWDGTYEGHPCPQANYVWITTYTTKESPRVPQVQKGSVLLLR